MKGLFWNAFGIAIVYLFTQAVNWSLWLSIPVGVLVAAVVVVFAALLVTRIKNHIVYRD